MRKIRDAYRILVRKPDRKVPPAKPKWRWVKKSKGKVVALHAMEALWVRGGIAPTLS
jgi:hypothetical protein